MNQGFARAESREVRWDEEGWKCSVAIREPSERPSRTWWLEWAWEEDGKKWEGRTEVVVRHVGIENAVQTPRRGRERAELTR